MSIEQVSPIRLTPYCKYNQEIIIFENCSNLNLITENELNVSDVDDRFLDYNTQSPIFIHAKSYPLANISAVALSQIAKMSIALDLYNQNIWLYVFNMVYFWLGPILLALSFLFLKR